MDMRQSIIAFRLAIEQAAEGREGAVVGVRRLCKECIERCSVEELVKVATLLVDLQEQIHTNNLERN